MVELGTLLPAVAVLITGIVSSAWCLVHGSTIGASEMVERKELSVWGRVLSVAGFTILILGVLSALMLMMPEKFGTSIFISAEIIIAAAVLVVSVLGKLQVETVATIFLGIAGLTILALWVLSDLMFMIPGKFGLSVLISAEIIVSVAILLIRVRDTFWVARAKIARARAKIFLGIGGISSILLFYVLGGDVGMIPVEVWRPLLGAFIMIGATICAAVCITTGVKCGCATMREKSESSIWCMLFVALGEGLAIYGLIVALLLIV